MGQADSCDGILAGPGWAKCWPCLLLTSAGPCGPQPGRGNHVAGGLRTPAGRHSCYCPCPAPPAGRSPWHSPWHLGSLQRQRTGLDRPLEVPEEVLPKRGGTWLGTPTPFQDDCGHGPLAGPVRRVFVQQAVKAGTDGSCTALFVRQDVLCAGGRGGGVNPRPTPTSLTWTPASPGHPPTLTEVKAGLLGVCTGSRRDETLLLPRARGAAGATRPDFE